MKIDRPLQPWLKAAFLITVILASSGYRFRCYWMCTDQTAIQNDYIEERDRCRDYAEAKVDMAMHNAGKSSRDDKARKSQLVSLFSECMSNHGWTVPDGKDRAVVATTGQPPASPTTNEGGTVAPAAAAGASAATAAQEKAFLARKAECDFARHSASSSSNAATRAQACDIECAQRVKNAPEAPRPAACPAEFNPSLVKGVDKE